LSRERTSRIPSEKENRVRRKNQGLCPGFTTPPKGEGGDLQAANTFKEKDFYNKSKKKTLAFQKGT